MESTQERLQIFEEIAAKQEREIIQLKEENTLLREIVK
jgi:hypothetical protein